MQTLGIGRAVARAAWATMAAILAIGLVGAPSAAAQDEIVEIVGRYETRLPDNADTSDANNHLIVNSERRRAYQFIVTFERTTIGRMIDLDTHRILLEKEYERTEFPSGPVLPATNASEWVHAVDPDSGDIFLAYSQAGTWEGIAVIDPDTLAVRARFPKELINFEIDENNIGCTSQQCLPQTPTALPSLRGLAFAPPELTGLQPKLLLLMEEWMPVPIILPTNMNVPWLAQWDIPTGRQDWIYRVSSCSNAIFPMRDQGRFSMGLFQARLGTGIYLGCATGGGAGQVVRVLTDGVNLPTGVEESFPGPQGVKDIIGDPASDRMLLNVANEDGISWWVFDGASKSYAGVVGATVAPAQDATGLDLSTGRLYMLVPPTAKSTQRTRGGFLMADIRRSPAPQALAFEEFAREATGIIAVDVLPETQERIVWARPRGQTHYLLFRDNEPISFDEPLRDLDRLTTDVEEEPGVTDRNFTASGRAYGFRGLFVGGLDGVPPTGPDASGVRVGRHSMVMAGTPCGKDNRELVLASISRATLSNDLSAANATVGDADPGTKTDVGEPSARCYPRPKTQTGQDIWEFRPPILLGSLQDAFGDYPEPHRSELEDRPEDDDSRTKTDLDEILGSDWPFEPTECAGDGSESTFAAPKPLDRGAPNGPIPQDLRDHEVELEGMSARVECEQSEGRVSAESQIKLADAALPEDDTDLPAFEQDVPGIGTIRVGEVSSKVDVYLDPARGLVARSEAMARHISIGDDIYIDTAYTLGESVAAGRFGSASTTFDRYLCGVRIADQAPEHHVYEPAVNDAALLEGDLENGIDPQGGPEIPKNVDMQGCSDEPLHTQTTQAPTTIDLINRVLGTRGTARAPLPDGELSQGTPGGYLASIQKERLEEISSRSLNGDASTQVPALELIIYNDDPNLGRARQIYQFAGVDATVTYAILLLNPFEDSFDFDPLPFPEPPVIFEPPPPPDGGPPPPPSTPPARNGGPITMLFEGVSFLLRSPLHTLLAAAVWGILFAPMQLSLRRRALRAVAVGR